MSVKQRLLIDTFESIFDMNRFVRFTTEFFNNIELINPNSRKIGIWKEYGDHISSYREVSKYKDTDGNKIIILAVELKKNRSVERARSIQRSFISKLLEKNSDYSSAIVAFYSEGDARWRLSFVRIDYSFTSKGIKLELPPVKRFSYLVGKGESSHTAQKQLLPIFEAEHFNPTVDQIEQAFSVEKVTKDFFDKYNKKYHDLREHLEGNEAFIGESIKRGFTSEQFAKKLMGQLAFLYFLQKKGWLGVKMLPPSRLITDVEYESILADKSKSEIDIFHKVFEQQQSGEWKLSVNEIGGLSNEEGDLLANCFMGSSYDMKWGGGTKTFIRDLFEHCVNSTTKNFFKDYLELLFYNALNKKRGENQYFSKFNCKIPFLNGGLFEPLEDYDWEHVNFRIPNKIFSNAKEKGKDADGILDIFDLYNFTINEDEPLEKEVAVDPEMLGKIFENLLDAKDRKSKGAFYTPREIVHYMCQESLVNYLVSEVGIPYTDMKDFILYGDLIKDEDNRKRAGMDGDLKIPRSVLDHIRKIDSALKKVKVADPAVGSGAFPLGMLNEIVKARMNITEYIVNFLVKSKEEKEFYRKTRNPYQMKWDTIKNSIFAVDIESSAIDIAKLRLWLSLVVDQEIDEDNPHPHALPNLDCNIMCGNSLIEEFEGIQLFDESLIQKSDKVKSGNDPIQISLFQDQIEVMLEDLFVHQDRLYDEDDEKKKIDIKRNIEKKISDLIRAKLTKENNIAGIQRFEESIKQKTKPYFLWKLEFAKIFQKKGGFDIVIGNPPYVGQKGNAEIFEKFKTSPKWMNFYERKQDLYYYFIAQGIMNVNTRGVISFIIPPYFLTASGARNLRRYIVETSRIKSVVNFSGNIKVFESASINSLILFLDNKEKDGKIQIIEPRCPQPSCMTIYRSL